MADQLADGHIRLWERGHEDSPDGIELPWGQARWGDSSRCNAEEILGVLVDKRQLSPFHLQSFVRG